MAQTIFYICGFETGDFGENTGGGATNVGASVQTTTVRTGKYAAKVATSTITPREMVTTTQSVARGYFQFPALPGADTTICKENVTGNTSSRLQVNLKSTGVLSVTDSTATAGLVTTNGTIVLAPNTWYMVCVALDLAALGVVKVWINGVLDISVTHTNSISASPTAQWRWGGAANPNEYFWDDLRIDQGGVAEISHGRTIARQGIAGTPNADAWAKVGAATAALCWSDTPFATGTNCTSSTNGAAQTMLIGSFASAGSANEGPDYITGADVINGAKVGVVVKTVTSATTPKIRRRVGAANTDTTVTLTTADAYVDEGAPWTTTFANLATLEAGFVHGADVNLETVEDVWVIVEFTQSPFGQAIF